VSEQTFACLSCGARPAGHRKFCRYCGVALNPEQVICVKCGAGIAGASNLYEAVSLPSNAERVITLNNYFMAFLTCAFIFIPLSVVNDITPESEIIMKGVLSLIILPLIIISFVYWCMLLYQLWKLIPANIARTTPGIAVGFQFIPIFWFYWYFVVYWGLSQDMNKTFFQRGMQYRVSEGLGLTFAIISVVSWAFVFAPPIVATPATLVGGIACIFFTKSVKDGGIALLEQG
jgi:hypothetical protein